jgi:hypothetical protein
MNVVNLLVEIVVDWVACAFKIMGRIESKSPSCVLFSFTDQGCFLGPDVCL